MRIWHWALLAHHEALPHSDSALPAALSRAVWTSPLMPHNSGRARHPLMPRLLPSPSPPCLDLPGTPQGAVGEILSPWVPKEHIPAIRGPCLRFPAWVQGLMGTAAPPAPSHGQPAPSEMLCAGTTIPALRSHSTAGGGRQCASFTGRDFTSPTTLLLPLQSGTLGMLPIVTIPTLPTRAWLVARAGAGTTAVMRGKQAPLGLQGCVQGPGTGMAGTGTIGQGRWVSRQGKLSLSLGPFAESSAWLGPACTTSKGGTH